MASIFHLDKVCFTAYAKTASTNEKKFQKKILNNVSFDLNSKNILGIIGPNGAGKSSLLKILAGLYKPQSGSFELANKPYAGYSLKDISLQLAYLEQSPKVAWALQVEHIVRLAFLNKPFSLQQQNEYAYEAMSRAEVLHLSHRTIETLSGGERVRVMLARLFATQAKVLLLDEPLASLDPAHQLSLMKSLQAFVKEGGTVCIVMHDLNHAYTFCDELLLLKDGSVFSHGSSTQVLSEKNIKTVYGVDAKIHHPKGDPAWIQLS